MKPAAYWRARSHKPVPVVEHRPGSGSDDLGVNAPDALIDRSGVDREEVDDVIFGTTLDR